MSRLKLGVLFGGSSEEHPISVKSAQEVAEHLDLDRYEPFYIGITKDGAWRLCDGPEADWENGSSRPAVLSPDRSVRGLLVLEQGRCETIGLDLVFPVLHGRLGEDGAIQGLLELAGIPYVGCDVQSSALCMDKSLAYTVAKSAGIATPRFWIVTANDNLDLGQLSYPVFVKPARSGSSFGVSKVQSREELRRAVDSAGQYDSKVLIEEAVVGSEVVPAEIPAESRARVQETAKAVYRALGCGGLARVDLFLEADGTVVLNEVNTLPGMTSYSRYPRMMAAAGLSRAEVIDRLISSALANGRR
jgi:D-alanine---(R)-lactate ligase